MSKRRSEAFEFAFMITWLSAGFTILSVAAWAVVYKVLGWFR